MLNAHVLMSSAKYFNNEQQINPYYADEPVDKSLVEAEHTKIKLALEKAGVRVTQVAAPSASQDGVYTANWALVRGNKAVLARLPAARKAEEAWARDQLKQLGLEVIDIPEDWLFSGQGDALPCGNYLFCGSTYRSDQRAQAFVANELGYERIQLRTVPQLDEHRSEVINAASGLPDSFYYDIDLALSVIRLPENHTKGLIAYCPGAFVSESRELLAKFDAVDKIIVSEKEAKQAFACNLVSTGRTVLMSAGAPKLKQALEAKGLEVATLDITELAKGGGFIRCTTLSFND